jgi:hypothetical protein
VLIPAFHHGYRRGRTAERRRSRVTREENEAIVISPMSMETSPDRSV